MNAPDANRLTQDLEASLGLPILAFFMSLKYTGLNPRNNRAALRQRLVFVFLLALFAYMFVELMYQDRAVVVALWEQNPVEYTLIYSVVYLLTLAGIFALIYFKLRPELWRDK